MPHSIFPVIRKIASLSQPSGRFASLYCNDGVIRLSWTQTEQVFDGNWSRRVNSQCNLMLSCEPLSGAF